MREIARMALALREAVTTLDIRHLPGQRLHLRAGFHSGQVSCVNDVIVAKFHRD